MDSTSGAGASSSSSGPTSSAFAAAPGTASETGLTRTSASAPTSGATTLATTPPGSEHPRDPGAPLADNEPQVIAAREGTTAPDAWTRRPQDTPQERFDAAVKEREASAPK